MISTQLQLKFGTIAPARVAEIAAADKPKLEHLLKRVVVASRLDAVFAD